MTKLEQLRKRLTALLNVTLANGATEAEAENAMRLAAKLMAEHNLTETDVLTENVKKNQRVSAHGNASWQFFMAQTIALNNGVLFLVRRKTMIFYGPPEKVELVMELYNYAKDCCITYGKLKKKAADTTDYKFWSSYGLGFAFGVAALFQTIAKETNTEGLVRQINRTLLIKFNESEGPTGSRRGTNAKVDSATFTQGKADGAQLRKPLTTRSTGVKQISG